MLGSDTWADAGPDGPSGACRSLGGSLDPCVEGCLGDGVPISTAWGGAAPGAPRGAAGVGLRREGPRGSGMDEGGVGCAGDAPDGRGTEDVHEGRVAGAETAPGRVRVAAAWRALLPADGGCCCCDTWRFNSASPVAGRTAVGRSGMS